MLPQKRKSVTSGDEGASSKKSRKDRMASKGKGRAIREDTAFRIIKASLVVSVPPVFAADPRAGAEEMLDSMVMRYIPAFQGVVLAHSNLQPLDRSAIMKGDCPFATYNVAFDATVWSPHVGMKLVGRISLCSPDHVSLLVYRTFNVSIPRHHIPADQWEFEYGPAEGDSHVELEDSYSAAEEGVSGGGRWIHRLTSEPLGGMEGFLKFTVIGLTVANEMLSLKGSIQDDPFSPEHAPPNQASNAGEDEQDEEASVVKLTWDADHMDYDSSEGDKPHSSGQFDDLENEEDEVEIIEVAEKKVKKTKKRANQSEAEIAPKKKKKRDRQKSKGQEENNDGHKLVKKAKQAKS